MSEAYTPPKGRYCFCDYRIKDEERTHLAEFCGLMGVILLCLAIAFVYPTGVVIGFIVLIFQTVYELLIGFIGWVRETALSVLERIYWKISELWFIFTKWR